MYKPNYRSGIIIIISLLLAFFYFGPLLMGDRIIINDDMISATYLISDYYSNHSNSWFPLSFGGYDLRILFYCFNPFVLISKIIPAAPAIGVILIFYFTISFLALFSFCRLLRLSIQASLLSSIIWTCNSWYIFLGAQTGFFFAVSWIPVIFWALERVLQRINIQNLLTWSVCLGLFLLQTHFQTIYYTALLCGPYTLVRLWIIHQSPPQNISTNPLRIVLVLFVGMALAILIASPQLAAAYQLKETTSRGGGMTYEESCFYGSLPPEELIGYYIPGVFGDWTNSKDFFEKPNTFVPHYWGRMNLRLGTDHMGIIAFLLASVGFWWNRKKPIILFFGILIVLLTLISFGKYFFLHRIFYECIPLYSSFRAPARFMIFVTMFVSILSGFGLDAIYKSTREEFKKQFTLIVSVGVCLLVIALLFFGFVFVSDTYFAKAPYFKGIFDEITLPRIALSLARPETIDTLTRYWIVAFIFTTAAMTSLLFLAYQFFRAKSSDNLVLQTKFLWAIIILSGLELIPFSKLYTTTIPLDNIYYREDAVTDFLIEKKHEGKIFRIFNQTDFQQFLPNKNILFDIESATGYQPSIDNRYMEVMSLISHSAGTFNLLNVRYLLFPSNVSLPKEQFSLVASVPGKDLVLFENKNSLPRFYLVENFLIETDPAHRLQSLLSPDVIQGKRIILEEKPERELQSNLQAPTLPSLVTPEIQVITYTPDRIELKIINSQNHRLLYIGNTWAIGWQAYVNGSLKHLLRANHAFQALEIPSGNSVVILKYENKLLQILWIFGWGCLTIIIIILLCLFIIQRKKLAHKL